MPSLNKAELQTLIFPKRLMALLADESNHDCVRWAPDGLSFCIVDQDIFAKKIMPMVSTRTSVFSSFLRKLNRWGFSLVTKGPSAGNYRHSFFIRDKPHLASQMFYYNKRAKEALKASLGTAEVAEDGSSASSPPQPLPDASTSVSQYQSEVPSSTDCVSSPAHLASSLDHRTSPVLEPQAGQARLEALYWLQQRVALKAQEMLLDDAALTSAVLSRPLCEVASGYKDSSSFGNTPLSFLNTQAISIPEMLLGSPEHYSDVLQDFYAAPSPLLLASIARLHGSKSTEPTFAEPSLVPSFGPSLDRHLC